MHYAVIDLGTNTFHILIVKKAAKLFEEVYRKRVFVNIAEEGIKTIGDNCYRRAIATILDFHNVLREFQVKHLKVFATAALRTASNGIAFQKEVFEKTGIKIEIINGDHEAKLIAKGIKTIVNTEKGNFLIMDIGGGSVEFILIQDNDAVYIESFPIGITALYNKFPHVEPISETETIEINDYLKQTLQPLTEKINSLNFQSLIGASGSFEVLEKILSGTIQTHKAATFSTQKISEEIEKIIVMDLAQRLAHHEIPTQRAKLIVVAFLLIKHILALTSYKSVIISPFALKEGALAEMMNLD